MPFPERCQGLYTAALEKSRTPDATDVDTIGGGDKANGRPGTLSTNQIRTVLEFQHMVPLDRIPELRRLSGTPR